MVSKTELNKSNLKILFGKNHLTQKEKELYEHISDDKHKIKPKEIREYFPRRKKTTKSKVRRGRYE